jgi:hypothetical protein
MFYFDFNRLDFRFDVILWNFSNLSACFRLWLCLFLSTCIIIYYGFHLWAYKRLSLIPKVSSSSEKTIKKPTSLCKIQIEFFIS